MKEYIEINGEQYPLLFDTWSIMHFERWLKGNMFLHIREHPEDMTKSEFCVNLTYSGIFGGLDLDDDKDMPISKKQLARGSNPMLFEKVIEIFGKQMQPEGEKKQKPIKEANP